MAPSLPSPQQKWSHCTNSFEELIAALENDEITAIEADVLIGSVEERPLEPIMAHPPKRTSNLSTQKFLEHTVLSTRVLRKHIKLDLKEMAVVPLTLALLRRRLRGHSASATNSVEVAQPDDGNTVFLNADIYPGPGARNVAIVVDADAFLEVCLEYLSVAPKVAFSLGFKVDYRAENEYYSEEDDRYMTDLVHRYELHKKAGALDTLLRVSTFCHQIPL